MPLEFPLNKSVEDALAEIQKATERAKKAPEPQNYMSMMMDTPIEAPSPNIAKSIMRGLGMSTLEKPADRLSFETDPLRTYWSSVFVPIENLVPNAIKKRISVQDSLVAQCVLLRTNQIAAFFRPRPQRSSNGYIMEITPEVAAEIEEIEDTKEREAQKKAIQKRIARASKLIMTCGEVDETDRQTFKQFAKKTTRDAIVIGSMAVEFIYKDLPDVLGGRQFSRFRAIDAGTIYRAQPQTGNSNTAKQVRDNSRALLEKVTGRKIDIDLFHNDVYSWIQVIQEQPRQAFTAQECVVHNFYPASNMEFNGYPITPIDTAITDITTHLNIGAYHKIYFESGRAAKGFLVITSEDVDEKEIAKVRQSWNSQINSTVNSFRVPIFGIPVGDDIKWHPTDTATKDMEFQYLADMNTRSILSSFQIGPEELSGYAYLSKGTASQSLSDSNNEQKITASRDQGLRPLLGEFEDFINTHILPRIDPWLAQRVHFKLVGLDAETQEKESIGKQRDQQLHMVYDELLECFEKRPIGRELGGQYPFNPNIQAILDKFLTVGYQKEMFFGVKGAAQDPTLAFVPNPFWFQWQQVLDARQQMQQQAAMGAPPDGGAPGGDSGGGGGGAPPQPDNTAKNSPQADNPSDGTESQNGAQAAGNALNSIDAASKSLGKSMDKWLATDMMDLAKSHGWVDRVPDATVEDLEKVLEQLQKSTSAKKPRRKR